MMLCGYASAVEETARQELSPKPPRS